MLRGRLVRSPGFVYGPRQTMKRIASTRHSRKSLARCTGLLAAFTLSVVAGACGSSLHEVTGKASRDMQCPVAQLTVVDVDSTTRQVSGCGKQETYVEDCSAAPPCRWINRKDAN